MLRKVWAWVLCAALVFAFSPAVFAEENDAFAVEIPMEGVLAKLEGSKSAALVNLAGGYSLEIAKMGSGGETWLRAVVAKGELYYGAFALGSRETLASLEGLLVECEAKGGFSALTFSALPDERLLASGELPIDLAGEISLTGFAQEQGGAIRPAQPVPETTPPESATDPYDRPLEAKVPPAAYVIALALVFLLLAALVLGNIFSLRLRRFTEPLRRRVEQLRRPKKKKPVSAVTRPIPVSLDRTPRSEGAPSQAAVLTGVKLVPEAEGGALHKRIVMQQRPEEPRAAQDEQGEQARMNAYFLGKSFFTPLENSFVTVGLRNREDLLADGGAQPLFAPHPKGRVFSLEEDSGSLYLNVNYFAPPSFVVQSSLRGLCIERVFALEDAGGRPLRLEDVLGYAVIGITPARTARTAQGFALTQRGKLIIGEN